MTDEPTVSYRTRIKLDIVVPEGVTTWSFRTTADGQSVSVSTPLVVTAEKERE